MTGTRRRRRTRPKRRSIRRAGLPVIVLLLSAACGGTASTPPSPSASPSPSPSPSESSEPGTPTAPLVPLAPELVGTWQVSASLDASGSQQVLRSYQFTPDGLYEYTLAMCRSSTDCSLVGQEQGYAQAANGILTLEPQTESEEGPRAWPYVVIRDPNVGDIQLHLTLPDGQVDIFYRA
jgi:hypothetical protein